MGLYQSYRQIFVSNNSGLLASGSTVDNLAVGQFGILDAKTYLGVTAPTYAKNKALYAVWGTPDNYVGNFSGVPNENEYSKIIKGKLIKKFRVKHAVKGQSPVYTVGWSGGVNDTDTLSIKPGESKDLFIKLTGAAIDRLYSCQGITKQFKTTPVRINDCDDPCTNPSAVAAGQELVDQINSDKDFRKFIKAGLMLSPAISYTTTACHKFVLSVCDDGTDGALGDVQSQYSTIKVTRDSRVGSTSTYVVLQTSGSAPANYTQAGVFVPDCTSCPAGYTSTAIAKVFQVRTANGVSAGTVNGVFTGEVTTTQVSTGPDNNVYLVTFPTTGVNATIISDGVAAGYDVTFLGIRSQICTLTSPVSTTWVEDTSISYEKRQSTYRVTLKDSVCGTTRLADLQAAYPDLVVSTVAGSETCVHTYETTNYSDCYAVGCSVGSIKFNPPAVFENQEWVDVTAGAVEGTDYKVGIEITTAFINVATNECTFDYFPYENDVVHVQISNYNPDFNADPEEVQWAVKQIRQVQYPQGHGAYVQHLEKESKGYDHRDRSSDPVVRQVQAYSLQADPNKYYDEYTLEYDTKFKTSGGWSETTTQSIHLVFFIEAGKGTNLEAAFNGYLSSAGIEEDGAA